MKITFEFDTDSENFDPTELERVKQSDKMARVLWDMNNEIRGWYKYPSDKNVLNADTLNDRWCDLLIKHGINLDDLWD